MADIFYIKRGDTSPALRYTLLPSPIDLTGATVRFSMRMRGQNAPEIDRVLAQIESPATAGVVLYNWQSGDTATDGERECEFEVTYADGSIETFPNYSFETVQIGGDIS